MIIVQRLGSCWSNQDGINALQISNRPHSFLQPARIPGLAKEIQATVQCVPWHRSCRGLFFFFFSSWAQREEPVVTFWMDIGMWTGQYTLHETPSLFLPLMFGQLQTIQWKTLGPKGDVRVWVSEWRHLPYWAIVQERSNLTWAKPGSLKICLLTHLADLSWPSWEVGLFFFF